MSRKIEMIGKRFGRLIVIKEAPDKIDENTGKHRKRYYADCDCGTKNCLVYGEKLRSGHTKSCGCLVKEIASKMHKKYNQYDLSGDYGIGITSNTNVEFYFDLEDYDLIKNYCWAEGKNGYLMASNLDKNIIYMHRLILNTKEKEVVDHKNHNKLDNRKENIRIGKFVDNAKNLSMRSDNTSGATGVWYDKRSGNWCAEIKVDKNRKFIGSFGQYNDAVDARRIAEEKYQKDWSFRNSTGYFNNQLIGD